MTPLCEATGSSIRSSSTESWCIRRSSASCNAGSRATRRCTWARSGHGSPVRRPALSPPLKRISIQGYRAARELEFEPGSLVVLVGEASSGKSTVLTAIWTLLEAAAPPPTIEDVSHGTTGRIHLEADLDRGSIFLDARP